MLNQFNEEGDDSRMCIVINETIDKDSDKRIKNSYIRLNSILSDKSLKVETESLGTSINKKLLKYIAKSFKREIDSVMYLYE